MQKRILSCASGRRYSVSTMKLVAPTAERFTDRASPSGLFLRRQPALALCAMISSTTRRGLSPPPALREQRRYSSQSSATDNNTNTFSAAQVAERMKEDPNFRASILSAIGSDHAPQGAESSTNTTSTPPTSAGGVVKPPPANLTATQWLKCAIRTGTPFFGFGICDNLIMISVGDLIDTHFGVTLGFSTMVAAGLGQAVSDGTGITIQQSIEAYADRMGLPNPNLTEEQQAMPRVLFWQQVFRTVGIILGCLAGLTPVILFDTGNRPRLYDQLLNCLSPEQRKDLSSRATYVFRDEGDYIFKFGEEADAMYTIVTGEVAVIGRSDRGELIEFCRQGPGSNIGIIELAFGHQCVADVIVTTNKVKMLRVDRRDFENSPKIDEIRRVVTQFVEEDDTFVVYRARHMIPSKAIDIPGMGKGRGVVSPASSN